MKPDFSGWATKKYLRCSDGLTIGRDAFSINDGTKVPLMWNHNHSSADQILGHAMLYNKEDGIWADCYLNDSTNGINAKKAVCHGDIISLSIGATNVTKEGNVVTHGVIREVSLVVAGANPGAFIESVISHGEPLSDYEDSCIIYTGEGITIEHSYKKTDKDEPDKKTDKDEPDKKTDKDEPDKKTDKDEPDKKTDKDEPDKKTIKDVLDTLTEEQEMAVGAMLEQIIGDELDDEGGKEMRHNMLIDRNEPIATGAILTHDDVRGIIKHAIKLGSLKAAIEESLEDGVLKHALDTTGMIKGTGNQTYGVNDLSMLFPDYKTVNNEPEFISRDMDWVNIVINTVHRTPFSRIKSVFADITEDEARAKGYIKGKQKKEEVFSTLKRSTDPQTIYKKQKLDRDDIIDITDFNVITWIRKEMRMMLDEEIARAILIGDGRPADSEEKIKEIYVRPIISDVPLFNTTAVLDTYSDDTEAAKADRLIDSIIRERKHYKGSGNPIFFTTEDWLTEMLLLKDKVGHRLYKTVEELATAIRASKIVTVEPMETTKIKNNNVDLNVIGVMVNLKDYNVGADRGGEVNAFEQFDIDFNQNKYLIETRMSGALVKPFSAVTFLEGKPATPPSNSSGSSSNSGSSL